jgi:hypothetical protein
MDSGLGTEAEAFVACLSSVDRGTPEPHVVRNHTIFFVPEMALRPDLYTPSFTIDEGFTTFVIDYNLLAMLPASQPGTAQSTSSRAHAGEAAPPLNGDLQQIRDEMKQNVTVVEELRKELQELKRRLGEAIDTSSEAPSKKTPSTGSGKRNP